MQNTTPRLTSRMREELKLAAGDCVLMQFPLLSTRVSVSVTVSECVILSAATVRQHPDT